MNSTESMTFQEVEAILRIIDATPHGGQVDITLGGMNLKVSKEISSNGKSDVAPGTPVQSISAVAPVEVSEPAAAAESEAQNAVAATAPAAEGVTVIEAPMTGVFYRQPTPDAEPFVVVGQHVNEGDVVAIVEVMKLMNRLSSPVSGTVSAIRGNNEQLVEHGQVLFEITADEESK
ncbi:hypothetical protein CQ019_06085 [Arthrobacter sp. MYb229]|nr:hypothetical protein CQ019_06085 [Arthrobacter sp. MYb229]PRB47863.1 hypothetical protein CQ013_15880 [Arthrobacter sp. MYb216]